MDKLTSLGVGKCIAIGCTGVFAGAALYINVVEIPAISQVQDTKIVLQFWKEAFSRARQMQGKLVLLGTLSSGIVYYYSSTENKWLWILSSGLLSTMLPWTHLVMMGDIKKLHKDDVIQENGESWVRQKISQWNRRHMFRTLMSGISFKIMLLALHLNQ